MNSGVPGEFPRGFLISVRGAYRLSSSTLVIHHTAGRSINPCGYQSSSHEAFQQDDVHARHAATSNRTQWRWQTNSSPAAKTPPRTSTDSGSKGISRGQDSMPAAAVTSLMHEIKQAAGSPSSLASLLHHHCATDALQLSAVQLSALGSGLAKSLMAKGKEPWQRRQQPSGPNPKVASATAEAE